MATTGGRTATVVTAEASLSAAQPLAGDGLRRGSREASVEELLFSEGYVFNFFQAVRLLERLDPSRRPVGLTGPPAAEAVRFNAHLSLAFPPSQIYEIDRPGVAGPAPRMVVAFMGLTGPSGVLPRHYTELLLRLEREAKGPEKRALRAWLDLFNHRLISLFYRAWEKYRFYIPYERGEAGRIEPDAFTQSLFSLVGLGTPALRNRLRVSTREEDDGVEREKVVARLEDLVLLYYSGFLAHRPRCAVALEALLRDYFQLPVEVRQFQGQWLHLDPANQSRLGGDSGTNELGKNLVAGERVWDVQCKIRLRIGPLRYDQFAAFLPDRSPAGRKAFFLLCHLVRLYVGPELDFDVQLVLAAEDVPGVELAEVNGRSPRLGWNTWIRSGPQEKNADDPVFEGQEVVWLDGPR